MSTLPKKILLSFLLISLFIFTPSTAFAKDITSVLLSKTDTYSGDYIRAGETVTLSGVVEGDAYLGGGTVLVDGIVKGDLLVAGGNITIVGEVEQNVRAVGGTVNISGRIGKNLSLAGGNVNIGKDAQIAGNLAGIFGNLEYLGNQKGSMNFMAGNANLNGSVEGNIEAAVGSLSLGENAKVAGNLSYTGKNEAVVAPNAIVSGTTDFKQAETASYYSPADQNAWGRLRQGAGAVNKGFAFVSFAIAAVIGYLFLRLFPHRAMSQIEIYARRPVRSLALGLLTFIAVPGVSLLFAVTVIGLPISFLIMMGLAVIVYFAKIVIALYLGRIILLKIGFGQRAGWALLLGLLIYYVLGGLPFIGPLIKLLVLFAGSGAIITDLYRLYRSPTLRRIL